MNKKFYQVGLRIVVLTIVILYGYQMAPVSYATGLENKPDEENMVDVEDDTIDDEDQNIVEKDEPSELENTVLPDAIQCNDMLAEEIHKLKIFNKRGKVLKVGVKGELVKSLHMLLKWLHYDVDETSSQFSAQTEAAVIKFQQDHSMKGTGIVDKLAYIRLNDYLHHSRMAYDYVDYDVKIGPTDDYWIIINKTTNVLQLYKGKNRLRVYRVATGRYPSYTPEGQFKIANKLVNAAWKDIPGGVATNPLGSRWMGLTIGNHTTYGIHGCGRPESIGTYASAGCIRMYNFQVEELYDLVPVHTPVWIGTTDKIEAWVKALHKTHEAILKKQEESKMAFYEDLMPLLLEPYVHEALTQYYGEVTPSRTVDMIRIEHKEQHKGCLTIILEVTLHNEMQVGVEKEYLITTIDLLNNKQEVAHYEQ